MGKDKGDKKAKDAGFSDDFGKPSEAPAGGEAFRLEHADNVGKLFLITPLRSEETKAFGKAGEKGERQEIIVADVVEIDKKNPDKSVEHAGVWLFGGWVKGAVRGFIGQRRVLAILEREESKDSGTGYIWKLADASDKDIDAARAYLASIDPFAVKPDADDKPAKKGKKK